MPEYIGSAIRRSHFHPEWVIVQYGNKYLFLIKMS